MELDVCTELEPDVYAESEHGSSFAIIAFSSFNMTSEEKEEIEYTSFWCCHGKTSSCCSSPRCPQWWRDPGRSYWALKRALWCSSGGCRSPTQLLVLVAHEHQLKSGTPSCCAPQPHLLLIANVTGVARQKMQWILEKGSGIALSRGGTLVRTLHRHGRAHTLVMFTISHFLQILHLFWQFMYWNGQATSSFLLKLKWLLLSLSIMLIHCSLGHSKPSSALSANTDKSEIPSSCAVKEYDIKDLGSTTNGKNKPHHNHCKCQCMVHLPPSSDSGVYWVFSLLGVV